MRECLAIRLRIEPVQPGDLVKFLRVERESALVIVNALLAAVCRRVACRAIATASQASTNHRNLLMYAPDDLSP